MSTMNLDITGLWSRRPLQWSDRAGPRAAISTPLGSRDLISVVAFAVIGLLASILFALLFPEGLLTFV